jgi:ATP-dependent Clp protease ATP-binding subunit ClpA
LKRLVQRHVETLLARKIIADQVQPGAVLTVDVDENETFVVL